tara:strand:+ start:848 stop:1654 length:807 start_codon:yes stop_codon:yes gene_type:complete
MTNMCRIKATIEYTGQHFSGFQLQDADRTVQGVLEEALSNITGGFVRVAGAGRTDSGVHAKGQVIAFDYQGSLSPDDIMRAMNAKLPDDVAMLECVIVPGSFDPRRDASLRAYQYRILNRPFPSAFRRWNTWHVARNLDVSLMSAASRFFVGTHDFASYIKSDGGSTVRYISDCVVWQEGDEVVVRVRGNAFGRRMVRRMVGALTNVGLQIWEPDELAETLVQLNGGMNGPSAPAHGLTLLSVEYGNRISIDKLFEGNLPDLEEAQAV